MIRRYSKFYLALILLENGKSSFTFCGYYFDDKSLILQAELLSNTIKGTSMVLSRFFVISQYYIIDGLIILISNHHLSKRSFPL
jgi:hypothetical protein